jgi:hypothetical protein
MSIEYKIRSFNQTTGSIVVEFMDFTPFNIDLPVENGLYPEGEALDAYIRGFLPVWVVERKQVIQAGVSNAEAIASLVEPLPAETNEEQAAREETQAAVDAWNT